MLACKGCIHHNTIVVSPETSVQFGIHGMAHTWHTCHTNDRLAEEIIQVYPSWHRSTMAPMKSTLAFRLRHPSNSCHNGRFVRDIPDVWNSSCFCPIDVRASGVEIRFIQKQTKGHPRGVGNRTRKRHVVEIRFIQQQTLAKIILRIHILGVGGN